MVSAITLLAAVLVIVTATYLLALRWPASTMGPLTALVTALAAVVTALGSLAASWPR